MLVNWQILVNVNVLDLWSDCWLFQGFEGVAKCMETDTLGQVMDTIVKAEVRADVVPVAQGPLEQHDLSAKTILIPYFKWTY